VIRQIACVLALCVSSPADEPVQPSLTIYNQHFAVVRQELPLNLRAGLNSVQVTDITMHLEPDSVILRDPTGKHAIQVLEQNYRADPISESLLLSLNEGKTIDFLAQRENKQEIVRARSFAVDSRLITTWLCAAMDRNTIRHRQRTRRAAPSSQSSKSRANYALVCREPRCFLRSATTVCSSPLCNGCSPLTKLDFSAPSSPTSPED
jgi:hypothetical protein